jgi:hypothetical protein
MEWWIHDLFQKTLAVPKSCGDSEMPSSLHPNDTDEPDLGIKWILAVVISNFCHFLFR